MDKPTTMFASLEHFDSHLKRLGKQKEVRPEYFSVWNDPTNSVLFRDHQGNLVDGQLRVSYQNIGKFEFISGVAIYELVGDYRFEDNRVAPAGEA